MPRKTGIVKRVLCSDCGEEFTTYDSRIKICPVCSHAKKDIVNTGRRGNNNCYEAVHVEDPNDVQLLGHMNSLAAWGTMSITGLVVKDKHTGGFKKFVAERIVTDENTGKLKRIACKMFVDCSDPTIPPARQPGEDNTRYGVKFIGRQ